MILWAIKLFANCVLISKPALWRNDSGIDQSNPQVHIQMKVRGWKQSNNVELSLCSSIISERKAFEILGCSSSFRVITLEYKVLDENWMSSYIYWTYKKCMRLKKCIQSICLWVVKVRLDTSILPYKMHYQEMICLQFARKYIFLIAKEKTSRTYKRSSTSKEPHIGHYSLLIRVSRRKATLVARCMVNAIT